jgi:hypothetical protein
MEIITEELSDSRHDYQRLTGFMKRLNVLEKNQSQMIKSPKKNNSLIPRLPNKVGDAELEMADGKTTHKIPLY